MPHIAVSVLSHQGLVRERNEDSLVAGPWTLCATVTDSPQTLLFPLGTPCVIAVADGLGGHPGGEVASSLTVRRLADAGPGIDGEAALREELRACNRALYDTAAANPALTTMGTTVAGLVLAGEEAVVFNIGDSQVLDASDAELRRLSVDDSPPLPPGRRTTNVVTSTLGGSATARDVEPHLSRVPLTVGTRLLVCSDGLTDPVPPEQLATILAEHQDGRAAYELWRAAIEAGGPDNITLALVSVEE